MNESVDRAIEVLNEALGMDRDGISRLMSLEVEVWAEPFEAHPSIQVSAGSAPTRSRLRPLGLINGLFGAGDYGWGFIAMDVDLETGAIDRFFRAGLDGDGHVVEAGPFQG